MTDVDPGRSNRPFEFHWLDAFCPPDEWYERDSFQIAKCVMVTTGWVLQQDRDYMVVAATYNEMDDMYTQVICIPRSSILKIREVPQDESST